MDAQINYGQVYDFVFRIDKRIISLEKDSEYVEKRIMQLSTEETEKYKNLFAEITQLKTLLREYKDRLKNFSSQMIIQTRELKDSIKEDSLVQLNSKLDELKFPEYITQRDLQ